MDEPRTSLKDSKIVKDAFKKIKDLNITLKGKFSNIGFDDLSDDVKTKAGNLNIKDIKNVKLDDIKNTYRSDAKFRRFVAGFMISLILGLGYTGYKVNEIRTRAFNIYLNEKVLATVRTEEEVKEVLEELRTELCSTYELDIVLEDNFLYEATHAKDKNLTDTQDLKQSIKSNIGFLVAGYSITVDGKDIAVFGTKEEAENLIQQIKEPFIHDLDTEENTEEIRLLEDVKIVKKQVSVTSLSNEDEILDYIKTGSEEIKTHIVEVGESFWTIAKMYDTSVDDLVLANSDLDPAKLKPGNEVKLLLPTPLINVETVKEVEYNEEITFDTKVELDDSMYKNQQKVKVEGINGESKILAKEIRHNGILVDKEIVNEEVLKKAVDKVVVKGTKEVPKTMATGIFMMPTRGRLTSGYGSRWGRTHKGIDIAASTGTTIKAADAGTVSYSGYKGSFGYMIEIDHGNGYKTRYAHCSKLLVNKGAKVTKGQHIANVGNTGRSTGSHLHFEVLKNGVNQNPSNYVK